MLRKSFGPKKEEEETAWRELYEKGFHKLYWSTNIGTRITTKLNLPSHVAPMCHIKMQKF
jgi:hypothetical protein